MATRRKTAAEYMRDAEEVISGGRLDIATQYALLAAGAALADIAEHLTRRDQSTGPGT